MTKQNNMRAETITCACGKTRAAPPRGAVPKRCEACQQESVTLRKRARALAYSRRPEVKERKRRLKAKMRKRCPAPYRRRAERVSEGAN